MTKEVLHENFPSLLEENLKEVDFEAVLREKGDLRNPHQVKTRQNIRLSRHKVSCYLSKALHQKEKDHFLGSYGTFEKILRGRRRLTDKITHLAMKNLADLSIKMFDRAEVEAEKLTWAERADYWFKQLPEAGYHSEPSNSRFHTVIQQGKLNYDRHLLESSSEKKRQYLLRADDKLKSVKGIIPGDKPTWQFALHTTAHLLASSLNRLASTEEEKRFWGRKWYREAIVSAKLSESGQSKINDYYLGSAAYALAYLAQVEPNELKKIKILGHAYNLISQVVEREEHLDGDSVYRLNRLKFSSRVASQVASLTKDSEEKEQWTMKTWRLNVKVREISPINHTFDECTIHDRMRNSIYETSEIDEALAIIRSAKLRSELLGAKMRYQIQAGDYCCQEVEQKTDQALRLAILKTAYTSYAVAALAAKELASLRSESENNQQYNLLLKSASLAEQAGAFKHAAHAYSHASQITEDRARITTNHIERLSYFQKCIDERSKSAELAEKAGELEHAAFALGLLGKVYQSIEGFCGLEEQNRWAQKAYDANLKAGEIWGKLGEVDRSKRSLRIASLIRNRISGNPSLSL